MPALTPPPVTPDPADPTTFDARAQALVAWLGTFVAEMSAFVASSDPAALATTLATAAGAGMIGGTPSGPSAQLRTLQQILSALPPQSSSYASIAAAIAASGATSMTIPAGTHAVSTSAAWSVPVRHQPGAVLQLAAGVVLTYGSTLDAGPWPLWSLGSGASVVLTGATVPHVWPQWWGATLTGVASAGNTAALAAAAASGHVVRLTRGDIRADAVVPLTLAGTVIAGAGAALSTISSSASSGAVLSAAVGGVQIEGLSIARPALGAGTVGVQSTAAATDRPLSISLRDVTLSAHATGLVLDGAGPARAEGVLLSGCSLGAALTTGAALDARGLRITGCAQALTVNASSATLDACAIDGSALTAAAVAVSAGGSATLSGRWAVAGMSGKTAGSASGAGSVLRVLSPELQRLTYTASSGGRVEFAEQYGGTVTVDQAGSESTVGGAWTRAVPGLLAGDEVRIVVTPMTSGGAGPVYALTAEASADATVRLSTLYGSEGVHVRVAIYYRRAPISS
ncbi:MAG: hypothetical protein RIQ53_4176 [Pseudomonadota bacterium]|jgi:hypothetical protein